MIHCTPILSKGEPAVKTIFTQRMAGWLMLNGFPLIALAKNPHNNRNVFYFRESPALDQAMTAYSNQGKN